KRGVPEPRERVLAIPKILEGLFDVVGGGRPNRDDDRARPTVRHADRPIFHDAVHRGVARTVVLVAGAGAPAADSSEVWRRGHAAAVAVLAGSVAAATT